MSLNYKITLPIAEQLQLSAGINAQVLPLMNQAVRAIAQQTAANWQEAVYKAKLWEGERDAYAKSITWRMTGDFSAMVETDYEKADEIENGRPARDLKAMLNTSQKVRVSQKGKRFLVIPLRHNTPGNTAHAKAMPANVFALAKAMKPTKVLSTGQRPSGQHVHISPNTGMTPVGGHQHAKGTPMVASRTYQWGGRLSAGALAQAGADKTAIKHFKGMVKMQTSTPGGKKSSSYMTFRIMMEGQSGWVVPAQPGLNIAKKVAEDMQPKAEAAMIQAVKLTVSG